MEINTYLRLLGEALNMTPKYLQIFSWSRKRIPLTNTRKDWPLKINKINPMRGKEKVFKLNLKTDFNGVSPSHPQQLPPFKSYSSAFASPLPHSPYPPTGHPEACWNTMPVLAQAPTSGPNVEVTSSEKNGIVSLEKHNTLETLISSRVLCCN